MAACCGQGQICLGRTPNRNLEGSSSRKEDIGGGSQASLRRVSRQVASGAPGVRQGRTHDDGSTPHLLDRKDCRCLQAFIQGFIDEEFRPPFKRVPIDPRIGLTEVLVRRTSCPRDPNILDMVANIRQSREWTSIYSSDRLGSA